MKKNIILILAVLFSALVYSQVGINTAKPNSNAGLHISERKDPASTTAPDKYNGTIIQRYTQTERDLLTYSDAPTNSVLKLAAQDNSLMIFNTTENCYNYWNGTTLQWQSMCGSSNAVFTFNCSTVTVNGTYNKGSELNSTNYISVNVNVTQVGKYSFTLTPNTPAAAANGYSFYTEGVFTATGPQTIRLRGTGIPMAAQVDEFTLKTTGSATTCSPIQIKVNPNIAAYSLNCGTAQVNGTYKKGTALNATNTITMSVYVNAIGAYNITTNTVNGMSFSGSGTFTSTGQQTITLQGTGTPVTFDNADIAITANTPSGNANCSVTVLITIPPLTYAVIGSNIWSWASSGANVRPSALQYNFVTNPKIKLESFTQLWSATSAAEATTNLNGAVKPDIILYYAYGAAPTSALTTALTNYVNAGGAIIYGSADGTSADVTIMINGIFGTGTPASAQTSGGSQGGYAVNNIPTDPIINGPYGNAAGSFWTESNGSTGSVVFQNIPAGSVQIAGSQPYGRTDGVANGSIVWYNAAKNFVFFGDSTQGDNSQGVLYAPTPQTKIWGAPNGNPNVTSSDAILEMNAIAWAIQRAVVNGINPH